MQLSIYCYHNTDYNAANVGLRIAARFTPALNKLKSAKRRLERAWSKSHSSDDLKLLGSATNHYHAAVVKAKRNFNISLVSSQVTNPRQLWKTVNKLLHRTLPQVLPSSESLSLLSQSFATFFSDKIHKLHTRLLLNHACSSLHIPPPVPPPHFSSFAPVTMDEISKLLSDSP